MKNILVALSLPENATEAQAVEVINALVGQNVELKVAKEDAIALKESNDSLKEENIAFAKEIGLLQDQLGAKDQQLLEAKVSATAEHEGKTYRFVVPKFKTRDGEFTAEEAANNPELVAKLVACGASVIEVVK